MGLLFIVFATAATVCLGVLAIGRLLGARWGYVAAEIIAFGAIGTWWLLNLPSGVPFILIFPGLPIAGAVVGALLLLAGPR
ncbi:hypothetical protein [Hyphomicrobium sp. NDB2Meth4]|uniref:hypothetical protein n=1 Tax=Hyphomicrobium sp. NDB2Meth4 TaxID=1892846 RepID=UPI000931B511|nr:hypothetical protein [Hyphomicrobium sp. NDB2Meth4]